MRTVRSIALLFALVASMGASFAHADSELNSGLYLASVPFRIVTGAVTSVGTGLNQGAKEAYQMSADANQRVMESNMTPAQVLVWPFTITLGTVKGLATGMTSGFVDGYKWNNESSTN